MTHKIINSIIFLSLILSHLSAITVNIHTERSQSFDITYSTPELDETLHIGFTANLDNPLTSGNVASVICMRADDLTYTIADGTSTRAFAFMYSCSQTTCSDSLSLGANLFGGTVAYSSNTYTWTIGTDVSNTNRGNSGMATSPTSTFGLRADSEIWSNIPLEDTIVYLRCWAQYNVASATGTINSAALDITPWATSSETVAVTTSQLSSIPTDLNMMNSSMKLQALSGIILVALSGLIIN